MKQGSFIQRRLIDPMRALLWKGVTPEMIAWSLAAGFVVGMLPVLGSGTVMCTIVAVFFRLNLPAIQLANWASYPLQLALLLPYYRAGELLFGATNVDWGLRDFVEMFRADFWGTTRLAWTTIWHGTIVWLISGAILMPILYIIFSSLLRRVQRFRHA